MKTEVLCLVLGGAVFLGSLAFFIIGPGPSSRGNPSAEKPAAKTSRAAFPQDLIPALHRKPAEKAAAYRKDNDFHGCAILTRAGKLHKWHQCQHTDWRADDVETTEFIVVVDEETKKLVEMKRYVNGPPIARYQYELDAWLIEAKTGVLVASKHFVSAPREAAIVERYATTELGDPVPPESVLSWVQGLCENYRPAPQTAAPDQTAQGQ